MAPFELDNDFESGVDIRVIGVGGGGGNAVNRMIKSGLTGVEFWLMNTDLQILNSSLCKNKIQLGAKLTNGLGAGGEPTIGEESAEESEEDIREELEGADMVFVTCGLGGGTGTGSAPIIAKLSKKLGALTVAVATMPFSAEGIKRRENAELGLEKLQEAADTVIPMLSVPSSITAARRRDKSLLFICFLLFCCSTPMLRHKPCQKGETASSTRLCAILSRRHVICDTLSHMTRCREINYNPSSFWALPMEKRAAQSKA